MNREHPDRTTCTLVIVLLVFLCIPVSTVQAQDRLPPIPPEKMSDAQKKAVADYKALRKTDPAAPPWSVILRVPDWLVPSVQMRVHLTDRPVLSTRLAELVILLAAREWTNQYVWNAHSRAALRTGLTEATITAIAEGRRPQQMTEDEEIVYDFAAELLKNRSVSDATYRRALARFREEGVVEAAGIAGYYVYLAMIMNTARTPVPAGAEERLTRFPR